MISGQVTIWTLGIALLTLIAVLLGYCVWHDRNRKLQLAHSATSAAHIQAFMTSLPAPAWIDTADGIVVYHNPQMQQTSRSRNAAGKSLFELYSPEFAQQYYDNSQKVAQTQQAIEVIEPAARIDGSIGSYLVYKFPIAGSQGEPLVGGIGIDITTQLQTQVALETLARKEQTLSRVIQTIRNSIDIMPIFATAAREMADLLQADHVAIVQYHPEEKLWRRVIEHLQPETRPTPTQDIPDAGNPIAARLKQRELVAIDDAQTLQDNVNRWLAELYPGAWLLVPLEVGTTVWGCLTLQRDRSRSPWQTWELDFIRTVSEQLAIGLQQSQLYQQMQQLNIVLEQQVQERTAQVEQALVLEAALKRITDKVRDSLDESQILQTAVQELGRLLNATFCDSSLYDLEQQTALIAHEYAIDASLIAVGRTVQMSAFPELYPQLLRGDCLHFCLFDISPAHQLPDRASIVACPIVDDQRALGDLWLSKPQGEEFSELEIRLVQQVANQCAIALRQSRLFQAAQSRVDELARLHQLKDDFLSSVSHELRTPMYTIKLSIDLLERCLSRAIRESTDVKRYMQTLRDECDRETELIDNLLDLSRLEAKTEPLLPASIALQPWLLHLSEAFIDRTNQQQQALQFDLPADLPLVTTDFSHLDRIVTELLHNACKYTPAGEAIVLMARNQAATVQITVKNSGVEIPLEEQERIFDKFYRIPSSDPWKHGGTGLGLALVKRRVERIGGAIAVASSCGWTSFTLTLPRSAATTNPE